MEQQRQLSAAASLYGFDFITQSLPIMHSVPVSLCDYWSRQQACNL